ncbi:MAG: S8 family serine peptidase [Candidatus Alcyoniella australis]|nr:S8 family serine peptidase [Candidatus Alcyoniella australis]
MKIEHCLTIVVLLCAALLLTSTIAAAKVPISYLDGIEVRADAVCVLFQPGTDVAQMQVAAAAAFGSVVRVSDQTGRAHPFALWRSMVAQRPELSQAALRARIKLDGTPIDAALDLLEQQDAVAAAYPIYLRRPQFVPDDPYFDEYQVNLRQSYVDRAWEQSTGSGVLVAVIDTGYRTSGMSDEPAVIMPGYDFADNDQDVLDPMGHGTHISNTILESTDNGVGAAGIAFDALLLPLKVFPDNDEVASSDDIADAIDYAIDAGADVINMSLGGDGEDQPTRLALQRAYQADVVLVAAAGNDGAQELLYPAAYDEVIAVGSVTPHEPGLGGSRSEFSNYGAGLDLLAPGERILQESWSAEHGSAYYLASGTSSATPHVSATAALMISLRGRVNAEQVRQALNATAQDLGDGGYDLETGHGELDADAALDSYRPGSGPIKPIAVFDYEIRGTARPLTLFLDSTASYGHESSVESVLWVLSDGSTSEQAQVEVKVEGVVSLALVVHDDRGRVGTVVATIDTDHDTEGRVIGGNGEKPPLFCGIQGSGGLAPLVAAAALLALLRASLGRRKPRRCRAGSPAKR